MVYGRLEGASNDISGWFKKGDSLIGIGFYKGELGSSLLLSSLSLTLFSDVLADSK